MCCSGSYEQQVLTYASVFGRILPVSRVYVCVRVSKCLCVCACSSDYRIEHQQVLCVWVCGYLGVRVCCRCYYEQHEFWVTRAIMCARKAECVWLEVVTERVMCACVCVGGGVDG